MDPKSSNARPAGRTRRHLTKAASLLATAALGLGAQTKSASANRWGGGGWGGGGGGGCFLRGTRIATPAGERAIEDLQTGDLVLARFGGTRPIKSVQSFSYFRENVSPWPDAQKPVRVVRGAVEDNIPRRDLWLTPDHALYVDGVLIPAADLLNGCSIILEDVDDRDCLQFFHLELDQHDVIFAEGMPCETLVAAEHAFDRRCAPYLQFNGGRAELKSRLRSALAPLMDWRCQLDVIRDRIEERGESLIATAPSATRASVGSAGMQSQ